MPGAGFGEGGSGNRSPKRVVRTGLALVHENEIVYPAAGSAAQAVVAIDDASGEIQMHFPVVIEIAADAAEPDKDVDRQTDASLKALAGALRNS